MIHYLNTFISFSLIVQCSCYLNTCSYHFVMRSFDRESQQNFKQQKFMSVPRHDDFPFISRRSLIIGSVLAAVNIPNLTETSAKQRSEFESVTVGKITENGVKFFDIKEGDGNTPNWGQMVSMRFTLYGQESSKKELTYIDSSDDNGESYLIKHGNGRQIRGLEEGIHSMKIGGKRRVIIPPGLGYVSSGLGPLPAGPFRRNTLNNVLNYLGTDGQLVMDVELQDIFDDEADLGYYSDNGLTPKELDDVIRTTNKLVDGKSELQALPGKLPTVQF